MAKNKRLHQYVGEIVQVIEPDAYSSGTVAASDNDAGVSIAGMDGVLFIIAMGDAATLTSLVLQVQYSSTGSSSDAVTSNTGMTCSDAVVTIDSDGVNEVYLIDFNIGTKGLSDAAGKLYMEAVASSTVDVGVVAIPYGGNRMPSTNENTIVEATSVA